MTLLQMQARVSQRLNEGATGPVFYTNLEILNALNEGLRFFALLTLGLEVTASWTPAATFTHLMNTFSNWIVILRITDSTGFKVRPATLAELAARDPGWLFDGGTTPSRYVCLGVDLVGVCGTSGALNVTYARAPVALALATDIPEIPIEYHPALVSYALYRCRQGEGAQEAEKTMAEFSKFLGAADHYADWVRERNLGSNNENVPFEMESFDRSRLLSHSRMPATLLPKDEGTVPSK